MNIIMLLLKIFLSLVLLVGIGIGSFIYYDVTKQENRKQNYAHPEQLVELKVFKDFYEGQTCFYIKNTEGYVRKLDHEYTGDYIKDKRNMNDVVIHHNKLVMASGTTPEIVKAWSRNGKEIEVLTVGINTVSLYGNVEKEGIVDNKYFDRYYSASIVEVPCTFNPFTKGEPKKWS